MKKVIDNPDVVLVRKPVSDLGRSAPAFLFIQVTVMRANATATVRLDRKVVR